MGYYYTISNDKGNGFREMCKDLDELIQSKVSRTKRTIETFTVTFWNKITLKDLKIFLNAMMNPSSRRLMVKQTSHSLRERHQTTSIEWDINFQIGPMYEFVLHIPCSPNVPHCSSNMTFYLLLTCLFRGCPSRIECSSSSPLLLGPVVPFQFQVKCQLRWDAFFDAPVVLMPLEYLFCMLYILTCESVYPKLCTEILNLCPWTFQKIFW